VRPAGASDSIGTLVVVFVVRVGPCAFCVTVTVRVTVDRGSHRRPCPAGRLHARLRAFGQQYMTTTL
jgi:hypothetical protein